MSFFYLKDQFLASSNSFAIVKSNDSTGNLQKWLAKFPLRRLPRNYKKTYALEQICIRMCSKYFQPNAELWLRSVWKVRERFFFYRLRPFQGNQHPNLDTGTWVILHMYVMCAVLYQKMNQVSGKFSVYVRKFDLEREPVATKWVN